MQSFNTVPEMKAIAKELMSWMLTGYVYLNWISTWFNGAPKDCSTLKKIILNRNKTM